MQLERLLKCFELVPRTLAENVGLNATDIISSLYPEHASGNISVGIDLDQGFCQDITSEGVWDLYLTKFFALTYSTIVACTVLCVGQIIMAQ